MKPHEQRWSHLAGRAEHLWRGKHPSRGGDESSDELLIHCGITISQKNDGCYSKLGKSMLLKWEIDVFNWCSMWLPQNSVAFLRPAVLSRWSQRSCTETWRRTEILLLRFWQRDSVEISYRHLVHIALQRDLAQISHTIFDIFTKGACRIEPGISVSLLHVPCNTVWGLLPR